MLVGGSVEICGDQRPFRSTWLSINEADLLSRLPVLSVSRFQRGASHARPGRELRPSGRGDAGPDGCTMAGSIVTTSPKSASHVEPRPKFEERGRPAMWSLDKELRGGGKERRACGLWALPRRITMSVMVMLRKHVF